MFIIDFLEQATPLDDVVTHAFIECMVPEILERYVTMSAKGGTHQSDTTLSEQQIRGFEANADQSMFTHLLNGIFPSLRLMYLLEHEGIERFSQVERQVYVMSYLMHDVDKIQRRTVETKTRTDIEQSKACIADELRHCNATAFFPDVADYLEDITFLVVNTQQKWNTHLNTYLWHFRLPEKRIALLRRFCTYSDQIAYLVKSPTDISQAGDLAAILTDVSRNQFAFSYHQLREVRGLFTSIVNNGVVNLFTEGNKREGVWPYLFFSDGVVYIVRKNITLSITTQQVVDAVKEQLQQTCGPRIQHDAPGFKFSIQGIAKHPEYYFEFLSLEDYMSLLATSIIVRTRNDITATPFQKLRQMQRDGEIDAPLPEDAVSDVRTSMLSRFLSIIFATLLNMLHTSQETLRTQVEQELVEQLALTSYWDRSKTIPNKGGVEYRWFWMAAWYLHDHPGIHTDDGAGNLRDLFQNTFHGLMQRIGEPLRQYMQQQQKYLTHLSGYIDAMLELPSTMRADQSLPDFYGELEGYSGSKGKKGKKLCTLCNSAYPTELQADNAVLFQPWVYKNKLPLYAGANAGGVCAICALELMLRQLLQQGTLRLTGGKFEGLKTKYISIYPDFFFTAETGAMVQRIIQQLWDINFFSLRRELAERDLNVHDVLVSEMFERPHTRSQEPERTRVMDDDIFDDDDIGDTGDDEAVSDEDDVTPVADDRSTDTTKVQKEPTQHRYIKYDYPEGSYPGMCFFGMRAGKDDNDTASWAMPALLALALPLVTGAKVVISEMLLPLFNSGSDFQETVVFDAPHPYLSRLLSGVSDGEPRNRVRVNTVLDRLRLLIQVYQVNIDTYAKGGKPEWKHLIHIVRDLETDPLYLFSYLRTQDRIQSKYRSTVEAYLSLYKRVCRDLLGTAVAKTRFDMTTQEDDLGNIQKCVDLYTTFYRGGYESHSILKPVDIVAKAIINSPIEIEEDDLLWQIQGEMKSWLDRVRSHQATGYALFWGRDVETKEQPAIRAFVTYFYQQVFRVYCQGERGLLRSRLNRFKDGCEAYYLHLRAEQRIQEENTENVSVEVTM